MGSLRLLWMRLLTGDGLRKSRLHTYSGRMVDLSGLAYLPQSVWSVVLLKLFGYRQPHPWLGYRAVKRLRAVIHRDSCVLEFGSGMSSLFFAARCRRLVSVESVPEWYELMRGMFAKSGVNNVDYRLRTEADYCAHPDLARGSFDLVVVDGIVRDQCMIAALEMVKPGGYVFFDNSDVPWPDHKSARMTLTGAATVGGIEFFDDFYPFQIQVNESMLVRVSGDIKDSEPGVAADGGA